MRAICSLAAPCGRHCMQDFAHPGSCFCGEETCVHCFLGSADADDFIARARSEDSGTLNDIDPEDIPTDPGWTDRQKSSYTGLTPSEIEELRRERNVVKK